MSLGSLSRTEIKAFAHTEYSVVAVHDGTTVVTTVDGKWATKASKVGNCQRGGVLVQTYGQPCRPYDLTIEGTLDAACLQVLRQRYVERKLAAMFDGK